MSGPRIGILALSLFGFGAACDDGSDPLGDSGLVSMAFPARCTPRPMVCGRFSIRSSSVPGYRSYRLLEPRFLDGGESGPFLRASGALAALVGDQQCRLQLTTFADAP
jgi:hypothetical protein